jgi:ABC-type antimicrobial peptide transport system permease subunit
VEIGIRMALGATVPQVVRMVVVQSLRLALVGLVLGTAASLAGTRLMRSVLFEVSPTDPVVLASVGVLLLGVVLTASFAPARRAARIEPVEAMRG